MCKKASLFTSNMLNFKLVCFTDKLNKNDLSTCLNAFPIQILKIDNDFYSSSFLLFS